MTDMALGDYREAPDAWARAAGAAGSGPRRAAERREYRAYFVLLFLLELPLALIGWTLRAARARAWPAQGPLRAAQGRAALVASLILSV